MIIISDCNKDIVIPAGLGDNPGVVYETAGVKSLNGETGDLKIKTVNGNDMLGEGNIEIKGGVETVNGETGDVKIKTVNGQSLMGEGDVPVDVGVETLNGQKGALTLKTVNGNELTGDGNIEIKGGSDGNIITIIYGKDNRNIEAYKLLYNYTGANNAVSVNLQYSLWLYAATNIWTSVSKKRIYFDIFLMGDLSKRQLSYNKFYLTEDGTCSVESNTLFSVPTLMGEDVSDIRLKSINGASIVGDGEITVGGGSTAAYVYFRLENSNSIMDWTDNLEECGINMESFLDSNENLTTTLSCYCKVQEDVYQLVPFSVVRGSNGDFHIYLTAYCYSEWRRYDISASSWENLRYSPTINYTTIN